MDMLEPLTREGVDEELIEEQIMVSDDEMSKVECLSPHSLVETVETPGDKVTCTYRTSEGVLATCILKVENSNGHILAGPPFTSNTAVPQLLTSNLNGQMYVIGNTNEIFVTPTNAAEISADPLRISPRRENTASIRGGRVVRKDERRRMTHNEVERRRRDKINNWIAKLSKIIPESSSDSKGNGQYDGQSKGGILAKACEYIMELRESHQQLEASLKENTQNLSVEQLKELKELKERNSALETENQALRAVLRHHGIEVSITEVSS